MNRSSLNLILAMVAVSALTMTASAQSKKRATKKPPAPVASPAPADAAVAPEAANGPGEDAPAAPSSSTTASAISQYQWQPLAGQSGAQALLGYAISSSKTKQNGIESAKTDASLAALELIYQYGLTSRNSVGVTTTYSSLKATATPAGASSGIELKASGLGDVYFDSRNFADAGSGRVLFGASLGVSPGKRKPVTSGQEGNLYSGGLSLPVYGGYEADTSGGKFGAVLRYAFRFERTAESSFGGPDTATTGGHTLTVNGYYEGGGLPSHWLARLGYSTTADSENKSGGSASTSKGYSSILYGGSWGTYLSSGLLLALHYDGSYVLKQEITSTSEVEPYLSHAFSARVRAEF
ncbi:MAG TPA: hypothetical protein VFV50_07885 [Bdellovibrionales bacterium]|nr:hypothetical protein [Bdellovibrionales bacterium]